MLRSFRGQLSAANPSLLCSTALLLAMPLPLLDQGIPKRSPRAASVIGIRIAPAAPSRHRPAASAPSLQANLPGQAMPTVPHGHPYALTPQRRALLNTIRYAEGTWKGGHAAGYRTLYGGSEFASLQRHPRITVTRRYTSAAAGAYQFLPQTWDEASSRLQLRDFSPSSQDQAALYLVERRGALRAVDQHGLSRPVMARLAREWASFPDSHGGSHYGQPVKDAGELQRFYQANLSVQLRSPA